LQIACTGLTVRGASALPSCLSCWAGCWPACWPCCLPRGRVQCDSCHTHLTGLRSGLRLRLINRPTEVSTVDTIELEQRCAACWRPIYAPGELIDTGDELFHVECYVPDEGA